MSITNLLLFPKSVKAILLDITIRPGALNDFKSEVEQKAAGGEFTKIEVGYVPIHPPPGLYNYKCSTCNWWKSPDQCSVVKGNVAPGGWCFIWAPK